LNLDVGFKSPLRHTQNLWSDLRVGPSCRTRTGRETARTSDQPEWQATDNFRAFAQVSETGRHTLLVLAIYT